MGETVIYTGAIDAFYDYALGKLEYRTVRFETEVLDTDNYQGVAVVNYTDRETPYTRVIEHKHFEFGTQKKTVISREYSTDWKEGMEPYYPVNDARNQELYQKYAALAEKEEKVIFGGRLGEYKYYDMDKVIEAALNQWGEKCSGRKKNCKRKSIKTDCTLDSSPFFDYIINDIRLENTGK